MVGYRLLPGPQKEGFGKNLKLLVLKDNINLKNKDMIAGKTYIFLQRWTPVIQHLDV